MRLFVAINFNEHTKQKLLALRDELRRDSSRGRFSLPENLHLTLTFLGECDANQAVAVKAAMDTLTFQSFEITIERIGRFKRDGGDLWWASIQTNNALLDLQQNLISVLCSAGFVLESRKFSPHITLGREIVTKTAPRQIEPFGETVTSIELMKSERINGKLTYTAIYTRYFD
jgi:2'-5' RNA ligase